MSGISSMGMGIPSGASYLRSPRETGLDPNEFVPGTVVGSSSGATVLPSATANDFAVSPTPLDSSDSTYPTLITSHVAVLRAIGTPEAVIGGIAQNPPSPGDLDAYIQNQIMASPEAWDAHVGNPQGTARSGLARLLPGMGFEGAGAPTSALPTSSSTPSSAPVTMTPTMEKSGGGGLGAVLAGGAVVAGTAGLFVLGRRYGGGQGTAVKNALAAMKQSMPQVKEGAEEVAKHASRRVAASATVADDVVKYADDAAKLVARNSGDVSVSELMTFTKDMALINRLGSTEAATVLARNSGGAVASSGDEAADVILNSLARRLASG